MAEQKPDPIAAKLAELDALIEQQKARLASLPTSGGGITASDLKEILATQTQAQREIADSTRSVRHSNPDHLHISAFSHPEGDLKRPKAKLDRETYFNGHREREDDLTPAEIDAYNAIQQSCTAREDRGEDGMWKATVTKHRRLVRIPSFTADDRMDMNNGLVLNLLELSKGKAAVDPADMAIRIAALERQLSEQGRVSA